MIFQDPMSSLNPTLSIGRQIMEPVLLHQRVSRREAQAQALRLLELVGIPQPEIRFGQYPHHFSGGMRQRAAVAIALAARPRLLIADEPTTALDPDTQDQIMGLLRQLASDRDRAMLLVTHDLGLAEQIADKIAVMKEGRIVETGTAAEVFASPRHPYTKQLLRYARYGKGGSHYHGAIGWERHGKAAIDGTPLPEEKKPDGHPCGGREKAPGRGHGLTRGFCLGRGRVQQVLEGFDLTVTRGEIVGLVGRSGCGKSTLARCIMGIYEPEAGEIRFAEGCKKQMIFQDSASAFNPRMTIFDIIAEPLVIKKNYGSRDDLRERVYDVMDQVGLERQLAERHPYDISGGQRQRRPSPGL